MSKECESARGKLNDLLLKKCAGKSNRLENCDEDKKDCGCGPGTGTKKPLVDLVVLIDASGSMRTAINSVSSVAPQALKDAEKECTVDVRATYLLVDSRKPGFVANSAGIFTNSHQEYLDSIGAAGPFYHDLPDSGSLATEQGADAVADIAKFFDWRAGACRSVLYISDTILEGDGSSVVSNDAAVNQAINIANANNVTVFAHRCDPYTGNTYGGISQADCDPDYTHLCTSTGGTATLGGNPTQTIYKKLIVQAICNCNAKCKNVIEPELEPCITISWGDSDCDCLETNDLEVLCITVCNCYGNVAFSNFSIGSIEITDASGKPVATLPDGTPSVQAIPLGPICFGDILPCKDGNESCVSREFAIYTRGAKDGEYHVKLNGICYDLIFSRFAETCFKMKLCKD